MTEPPKSVPPGSAFEVPDLDLGAASLAGPPKVRPPAAPPASGAHPIRPRAKSADVNRELELELESTANFELAGNPYASASRDRPETAYFGATLGADEDFDLDEAMSLETVAPTIDTRPWPLGRTNDQKRPVPTHESVAERAGYGSSDVPFYLAPAYTWRVWSQRRALDRALQSQERELRAHDAERDRLLVELTLSLEGVLSKHDRFRGLHSELASATLAFETHERSLAGTNAAIASELEVYDDELARLEPERREQARLAQARQAERDDKATARERAHAKLKRVQIEVRNVTDKGRALLGPRGGALPSDLARQLSELTETEASAARELAERSAELDQANAALTTAARPLAETLRAMEGVREKKRHLVESTRRRVASESSRMKGAEAAHAEVAKRIALSVLDLKGSIPVDRAVLDRIQIADDRVDAALIELERLRLARDAFDHATYGLGVKILVAPFVFVLVLLLLRALV
jgi:DNA repair exonuclease SbcCD ATPase subunit